MIIDTRDLSPAPELALEHGVSLRTVHNWRKHPGFPAPVVDKYGAVLWDRVEVSAWVKDKKHGRQLEAIREKRRTGNIRHTARVMGVSPETVRRWCRAHGEPLPRDPWPEDVTAQAPSA